MAKKAIFVTVSIYDTSCTRTLLDWTIADVLDERVSVDAFYKMALAMCGSTTLQHLQEVKHCIEEAKVGKTKDSLTHIGNTGTYKRVFENANDIYCLCRCASCGPSVMFWTHFEVLRQEGGD